MQDNNVILVLLIFPGEHKIDVYHGGEPLPSGPFKAKVYSSNGVIVTNMPPVCMYGNPVRFNSKLSPLVSFFIQNSVWAIYLKTI